ncbi:ABC transporter ATP-binding protein [Treponema primitia]|uniref:ABC transporter ATP-binding protein n=1 Tax=Treponema primitia TaxID=88058 RepID=UPI0002555726|nr:ABC transporter ATP-binding protein [Treponema primitia]
MTVIEMRGIKRIYRLEEITVRALRGIDFSAKAGEFVSVMGPSGSGKSTLMNILGCLDKPSEGTYSLDGIETTAAGSPSKGSNSDTFALIRNKKIGFVFQAFNLLARTTALENVELPLFYKRRDKNAARISGDGSLGGDEYRRASRRKERAAEVLREVGLGDRANHLPSQLSGGQQQRVAIARAMVNDPAFILADEPTGNLDTEMTLEIMSLFQSLNDQGKTIIMVTHEPELAAYTKRIITLRDGELVSDVPIHERRSAPEDLAKWKKEHSLLAGEVS